jgi:hypothetical protein
MGNSQVNPSDLVPRIQTPLPTRQLFANGNQAKTVHKTVVAWKSSGAFVRRMQPSADQKRDVRLRSVMFGSVCSPTVPNCSPQLPFEGAHLGTKIEVISACKALPLEAVTGNLAERGGFEPPVPVLASTTV